MASEELVPTNRVFVQSGSRFNRVAMLQDDRGNLFFPTYDFHTFDFRPGDLYHEVRAGEEGRLDFIAYLYYQTTLLWWVIAEANDIFHPLRDMQAGVTLRIPDPAWVTSTLL